MGRFFKDPVENRKRIPSRLGLIVGGIIIVIIIFTIAIIYNKKQIPKTPKYVLKDSIEVEINSILPDVSEFFTEIASTNNVSYDRESIDISTIGKYPVTININGKKDKSIVKVVDTTAPELITKNVNIALGETYEIEDFIADCYDNSDEACKYDYINEEDQNITEAGVYYIELYAYDDSDNSSDIVEVILTIGDSNIDPMIDDPITPGTEKCEFGNLEYNDTYYNFPLAVIVGDSETGCALDMKEWKNPEIFKLADEKFSEDKEKLEKDIDTYLKENYPNGAGIYLEHYKRTVLNNTNDGDGLVGYGINVKLYLTNPEIKEEEFKESKQNYLVLEYFIRSDGSRQYITNKLNLE